jgi:hypothetical protein
VSIAFNADTLDPTPVWTRIDTLAGCNVRGWQIDRGRPTEFDKTGPGTATIQIVDRQGLFDPTNPGSPYLNKIRPGKQAAVALQNPVTDVWFTLFRGFVESWHYRLDPTEQYMELELQLVDGFAILARAELIVYEDGALPPFTGMPDEQKAALVKLAKGNVLYGETTGPAKDRIDAVLGDVGWPVALRDVFTGNVRVGPKAYGPGTSALDAIFDAVDGEFPGGVANCYMSKDGIFTFRGRQARFRPDVAEYGIQRRTVADPSWTEAHPAAVPVSELEWSLGQDNLYNAASATPQWIGTGAEIRQLNPDAPDNDNVAGQYVKDDDSIGKYGLRSITFDQLQTVEGEHTHNDSMVETKGFATYYVTNYKDPAPRVSRMVFKSRRPSHALGPSLWNHICKCEISDLLTLKSQHPGGGGFNQDFYVEGLHFTGRPGPPDYPIVTLELDVSPRANYTYNPFDADLP